MPYSTPLHSPAPVALPTHSHGRPGHRRSFSNHDRFTDAVVGPGAFASLGGLPRRTKAGAPMSPAPGPSLPKRVFHIKSSDSDSDVESDNDGSPPPLQLKPKANTFRLSLDTQNVPSNAPRTHSPIPFPRSSPLNSPQPSANAPSISSPRPAFTRTTSNPQIILSNGKVLKSSLKSSSSSPSIAPGPEVAAPPKHTAHLRARSAPATPSADIFLSTPSTPSTPKNVHFATTDAVRIFNRSARPAALSFSGTAAENDTETETESEAPGGYFGYFGAINMMKQHAAKHKPQPFPTGAAPNKPTEAEEQTHYEVDTSVTSTIPSLPLPTYPLSSYTPTDLAPPHPALDRNVYLENLELVSPPPSDESEELRINGTVVVRNLSFEKIVAVRFTLDDWNTTSEVLSRHVESLTEMPFALQARHWGAQAHSMKPKEPAAPSWDRFSFSVRLSDYAHNLDTRVLWLVVRYSVPGGGGEWWDNNGGRDFRVAFRRVTAKESSRTAQAAREKKTSAPAAFANISLPQSYQASGTLPQPVQPAQAPPAPPSTTSPTASVIAQRLSKLNLTNYSKPSISGLPGAGSVEVTHTGSKENSPPQSKDTTPMGSKLGTPAAGVGAQSIAPQKVDLHWSWGSSAPSAQNNRAVAATGDAQADADEQQSKKDGSAQKLRVPLLPLATSAHSISPSNSTSEEDEDDVFDKKDSDETPPTSPVLEKGKLSEKLVVGAGETASPPSASNDAAVEHVEDIKVDRAELVVPIPRPQHQSAPVVPLLEVEGAGEGQPAGRQRSDTLDDLPRQEADHVPLKVAAPAEAVEIQVPTKEADAEARVVREAVDALRGRKPAHGGALLIPGRPPAPLLSRSPSPSEFFTAPPSPSQRPQSPTSVPSSMAAPFLSLVGAARRASGTPDAGAVSPAAQQKAVPLSQDSLYDAFVKQWCFAGGPTPAAAADAEETQPLVEKDAKEGYNASDSDGNDDGSDEDSDEESAHRRRAREERKRLEGALAKDARFERPAVPVWKRAGLLLALGLLVWAALALREYANRPPKIIYASRYSEEYKYRPAASPIITETLRDGRLRIRGAAPTTSVTPTPTATAKPKSTRKRRGRKRSKAKKSTK
ncbi:putative phosphatase regulatory subunit-domain-containing protein [Schizophyllum fasciatum]